MARVSPSTTSTAATTSYSLWIYKLFCWSARDKAYLGLGTILYLNFLRWLSLLFGLMFLFSIPNILINSQGPRYTFASLNGDYFAFASTHLSVANLGSHEWTPIKPKACNNNGFSAEVCLSWGNVASKNQYNFPCGYTPSEKTKSFSSLSISILSNELSIFCESISTQCHCFEGYSGDHCENFNASFLLNKTSSGKVTKSWCDSPIKWWEVSDFSKRTELYKANSAIRVASVCSGHGACFTRTLTDDITQPLFSFCQCDNNFYGPYCENQVEVSQTFGSVYNIGIGQNDSNARAICNQGAIPSMERAFLVNLPPATCSKHGFGNFMQTSPDGSLNISNAFRVQSRGICFCEPGFAGEECLGGESIPELQGYMTCIHALLMTIVCCLLHQHRKKSERAVDDSNVSPRDFSVFVDKLPVLDSTKAGDLRRVYEHFEQFGKVYSVIPANHDENVFYFQREQNRVLLTLQKRLEKKAFQERQASSLPTNESQRAANDTWSVRPNWLPRLSPLVEGEIPQSCVFLKPITSADCFGADSPEVEEFWDSYAGILRILGWLVFPLNLLPIPALQALIRLLEGLLDEELQNPETRQFERAFITFEFQAGRDTCLAAYSERTKGAVSTNGEYTIINSKTKAQKVVNTHFSTISGDSKSTLVKGLNASMKRLVGSPSKVSATSSRYVPHVNLDAQVDASSSTSSNESNSMTSNINGDQGLDSDKSHQETSTDAKIKVKIAWEPDEVLWDALDTSPQELFFRGVVVLLYMLLVVIVVFVIVTSINEGKETGASGFLVSLGVVLINVAIGTHLHGVADVEQNYSVGKKSRSVFFKVLVTQLCVTILSGTLGVYGYPIDSKNGYIQDWFAEAGGFFFRTVLVETVIPPLIALIPVLWIKKGIATYTSGYKSYTEWMSICVPPAFNLDSRCASLMRTVILCSAFQSGLPILNLACAICLFVRYLSDMYVMDNVLRIQRSGAELARALEVMLVVAALTLACMSWILFRAAQAHSLLHIDTEVVFFSCLFFILWALMGYFSFKRFQQRDCCCGYGFALIPKSFPNPLLSIHELFMRIVFGEFFWRDFEDTIDETEGKSYSELCRIAQSELSSGIREDGEVVRLSSLSSHFLMRSTPYELMERTQQFLKANINSTAITLNADVIPRAPDWTGQQMRDWIKRKEEIHR